MQVARLIHTCCANPKTRDIHKYFSPQTPIGVIATLDVGLRPQPSTTGAQPK
jgi:hypothetical protein